MGQAADFEKLGIFYLGRPYDLKTKKPREGLILYDSKDLVTHAVCVGMTGSGKTGLCISLLEEAAIDGIPAIVIDPKGDLGNLLLMVGDISPFLKWALALIAGGGTAGLVQACTAMARGASSATTAGFANHLVASGEMAGSVLFTALAILLPVLGAILVMGMSLYVATRLPGKGGAKRCRSPSQRARRLIRRRGECRHCAVKVHGRNTRLQGAKEWAYFRGSFSA